MNFATLLPYFAAAVEQELPIFIHSKTGVTILNATEEIANPIIEAFSAKAAAPAATGEPITVAQAQGH